MATYELTHVQGYASDSDHYDNPVERCEVEAESAADALRDVTDWPFAAMPGGEGCATNPETSASYEDAWYARPVEA